VGILLALLSAALYGTGDYAGGHASRRVSSIKVVVLSQAVGLLTLAVALPILGDPPPPARDWMWGLLGGASGGLALICFYRALAEGAMTVVAPTTAVVSGGLPVVAGLALGEHPSALALSGAVLAVLAILLVTGGHRPEISTRHTPPFVVVLAVLAGLGFGALFVFFQRTSDASGLWPLVGARAASVPIAFTIAVSTGAGPAVWRKIMSWRLITICGIFDMVANMLYVEATRHGLLAVVGAIAALYPVSTIVLAYGRDGERLTRWQFAGLGVTLSALVLVAIG
jgi:drug/metabolite transporter (DMT)-like permease